MWTTNTPTEQGTYYFRDEHSAKHGDRAAWLLHVGPVRDVSRGLYAGIFGTNLHMEPLPATLAKERVAPLNNVSIILDDHPAWSIRNGPVADWSGQWWGPLPEIPDAEQGIRAVWEHTTHKAPTEIGLYHYRDRYAERFADFTVWLVAVVEATDERMGTNVEPHTMIVDPTARVEPTVQIKETPVTTLVGVMINPHESYLWLPVSNMRGSWWPRLPEPGENE